MTRTPGGRVASASELTHGGRVASASELTHGGRVASASERIETPAPNSGSPGLDTGAERPTRPTGRRSRVWPWALALGAALAASVVAAVTIGPAGLAPADVVASVAAHLGIGEPTLSPLRDGIVWELRMPRVLTAAAVGAGLALCGAVMQALTRNPLADPYLLGLSSGASVGAVIVIVLGVGLLLPLAAFAGALAALIATLALASTAGRGGAGPGGAAGGLSPTRTVLAGLAVSAMFGAITSLVIFWSATGDSYREILNWLLGSLAGTDWVSVAIAGGALVSIGTPLVASARTLDAFAFGDAAASALGVNVGRSRVLLLGGTALLTGALVAVSGSIGFVGLILPHGVRLLVGSRHRALLPLSALAGALFLIWADTAARTLFDPRELPVGIITALVGGPVFALLLMRRRVS
ncbi:putative F420-0 ABC transporter permease subunit [Agromyces sp. NPDC055520]